MRRNKTWIVLSLMLMLVLVTGCRREAPEAGAPAAAAAGAPDAPQAAGEDAGNADTGPPPSMEDVIEHDPRYVVGISYPPSARVHPGLARVLSDYAQAARHELMEAVEGVEPGAMRAPYELSLSFRDLVNTPSVVAVAADGSLYTGGAHGQPLVARFVWLPRQGELLTSERLLSAEGWKAVADYAAEQLGTAAHARAADEALDPAQRRQLLEVALKMIEEGTQPEPENFAHFEPVMGPGGRIAALRFVFPPYQVGPYADGVQYVEVPVAVFAPHLAPAYRGLFLE